MLLPENRAFHTGQGGDFGVVGVDETVKVDEVLELADQQVP